MAQHSHMTVTETKVQVDRCAREIEAGAPRDEVLYGQLLDRVVLRLACEALSPSSALAIAGQEVRGTAWSGYRSGRARLASAAAAYLTWLAPPPSWTPQPFGEIGTRHPIAWTSPVGDVLVDLLAGGALYAKSLVPAVRAAAEGPVVVRLLNVLAPMQSSAYLPNGQIVPLVGSAWWFEGGVR
jgi:hypothetical protein